MSEPTPIEAAAVARLKEIVYELRRLKRMETLIQEDYERLKREAIPLLRRIGSLQFEDPTDGEPKVATVVQAETLKVSYSDLVGVVGEERARAVCKPAEVDTKKDGLLSKAVESNLITAEELAQVATFKPSEPYVGFAKPRDEPES